MAAMTRRTTRPPTHQRSLRRRVATTPSWTTCLVAGCDLPANDPAHRLRNLNSGPTPDGDDPRPR